MPPPPGFKKVPPGFTPVTPATPPVADVGTPAPAKDEGFDWGALGRGAAQGATLGWGDETNGFLDALFTDGEFSREKYEKARDYYRKVNDQAQARSPKTYMGGQVVGGAAPAVLVPGGLGANVAMGALSGAGGSDAKDLKGVAADTATGAAFGAVAHGAAKQYAPAADKLLGASGRFGADYAGKRLGTLRRAASNDLSTVEREALAQRFEKEVYNPLLQNEFAGPQRGAVANAIEEIRNPPPSANVPRVPVVKPAQAPAAPVAPEGPVTAKGAQVLEEAIEDAQNPGKLARVAQVNDAAEAAAKEGIYLPAKPTEPTVSQRAPTRLRRSTDVIDTKPAPMTLEQIAEKKAYLQDRANYDVVKDTVGNANAKKMAHILQDEEEKAFARSSPSKAEEFRRLKRVYGAAQKGVKAEKLAAKSGPSGWGTQVLMGLGGAAGFGAGGPLGAVKGAALGYGLRRFGPVAAHGGAYALGRGMELTAPAAPFATRAMMLNPETLQLMSDLLDLEKGK